MSSASVHCLGVFRAVSDLAHLLGMQVRATKVASLWLKDASIVDSSHRSICWSRMHHEGVLVYLLRRNLLLGKPKRRRMRRSRKLFGRP